MDRPTYHYNALGLTLVCDRPLPYLDPTDEPAATPVAISLATAADEETRPDGHWRIVRSSGERDDAGELTVSLAQRERDHAFRLRYSDGVTFVIDRHGRRVAARWRESSSLEDATTYLLGPVLGFLVRLHGMVPLHASAVVIDGRAVALAGAGGAGKSTTAAAFATLGFAVLSDDITALHVTGDGFRVLPDSPLLKLWPRSSELLLGSPEALPNLSTTWDKRYLELSAFGYPAARRPHPLGAVYLLGRGETGSDALEITAVPGREGLLELVANAHGLSDLRRDLHARQFDSLCRLLQACPLRRIRRPARGCDPRLLARTIADDFRAAREP